MAGPMPRPAQYGQARATAGVSATSSAMGNATFTWPTPVDGLGHRASQGLRRQMASAMSTKA